MMNEGTRRLAYCPTCRSHVWIISADEGTASYEPINPGHRTDAAAIVMATMLEIADKDAGHGNAKRWKRLAIEKLGLNKIAEETT